jgi:hypothetical protein
VRPPVDLRVVVGAQAARADDDGNATGERRQDVLLDGRRVGEVDEDVGFCALQRLGDRAEDWDPEIIERRPRLRAGDSRNELQVVGPADRLGESGRRSSP